jgi:AraC-like DNA-binding protein
MSTFVRSPCPALAPWVRLLWASDPCTPPEAGAHRERVLPTGSMHIVFRIQGPPLTLYQGVDSEVSQHLGPIIVGGARSGYYVKRIGDATASVGVQLQPGGAMPLLGVPASALAEQHTALDALWGTDAERLHERLHAPDTHSSVLATGGTADLRLRARVDLLEATLLARLQHTKFHAGKLPWLTHTIAELELGVSLGSLVVRSGISHRAFITRFREMVGLPPKMFARIRRFQRVVGVLSRPSAGRPMFAERLQLARLALAEGYSDQAHLSRDFLEFAGLTPRTYARQAPVAPNHVQVRR